MILFYFGGSLRLLTAAPILILLSSCYSTFHAIKVDTTKESPVFTFEDLHIQKGFAFLLDITVWKANCQRDCIAWEAHFSDGLPKKEVHSLKSTSLVYGELPSGMKHTVGPLPLSKDEYEAIASTQVYSRSGKLEAARSFYQKFTIE